MRLKKDVMRVREQTSWKDGTTWLENGQLGHEFIMLRGHKAMGNQLWGAGVVPWWRGLDVSPRTVRLRCWSRSIHSSHPGRVAGFGEEEEDKVQMSDSPEKGESVSVRGGKLYARKPVVLWKESTYWTFETNVNQTQSHLYFPFLSNPP